MTNTSFVHISNMRKTIAFAPKCTLFCRLWFDRLLPGPIVVLHTQVGINIAKDKHKIYLVSLTAYFHKR